jgi:tetratricopeptide (TPR) repeat protein
MDLIQVRRCLAGLTIGATGILALPAALRAQQPTAAPVSAPAVSDTASLLEHAATQARVVAARLDSVAAAQAGRRAPTDPSATQYQNGLVQLLQGQCEAAYLLLRAAVLASPNSARNHGDLAFTLVCRQRPDDAATEYATAIRLQSGNPWYYVGLAGVRSAQQRYTEAAANYSLALAVDSTILYADLLDSATAVFQASGNAEELLTWSRMGTQKFPNDASSWLRVAMMLRRRGDTTQEGITAIRHFHALQPDNRLGDAILSLYLSDVGQNDSALVYSSLAAADTALREYASLVFLRVGARLLTNKEYEHAAQVLTQGRDMASPGNHSRYSLYLAHANIQRAVPLFQDAVQKKNCVEGKTVDSILTTVDHDLRESMALDSVQSTHILTDILPQFKSKVDDFKGSCR